MVEDLLSQWDANRGLTSSPAESVRLWGGGGRGPDTDGRLGKMPVVPLLSTGQNGSLAPPNRQSPLRNTERIYRGGGLLRAAVRICGGAKHVCCSRTNPLSAVRRRPCRIRRPFLRQLPDNVPDLRVLQDQ